AEAELAAASARIGVAEAELYPKLTLSGTLGIAATQVSNLGPSGAQTWSFGPALSLPIFEGGRLRSVVAAREAALDGARARYEQTVLGAVGEVETAAATLTETRARRAALVRSLAALQRALGHADDRYRAGVSSFLDVLDAQRALFVTEIEVARADRDLAAAQVRLHKALGQGW
ncbi:MAG TPA: TolC family protein, partial [Plasticicumulans sp.]|nr:TolC family protein [Plasticicumulans sp.]